MQTRILHVVTVPMSLHFLKGQVAYLREFGFEVHAVSSPGPELVSFGAEYGVATHGVQMSRRIAPFRDLAALISLIRVIRSVRPDIVHAHTPKAGLLGIIAAAAARAPVRVYHMRGLPLMTATGTRRALLRVAERLSCRLAHRVFCVSDSLRRVAIHEALCRPERIVVLGGGSGQGVDAAARFNPDRLPAETRDEVRSRLGIPANATVIGFVGRLVGDKGIVELEAAWRTLREQFTALHMLVVGPWEGEDPVPDCVRKRMESDPRIHLAGKEWNTPPLYAGMDVLALPTYREGFPNVPLEAAAMRLPVVATNVPGCSDAVVDGVTGTLVPVRDSEALAEALRVYITSPDLRMRHGAAGRQRVLDEFQPAAIHAATYREYCSLLGRPLKTAGRR